MLAQNVSFMGRNMLNVITIFVVWDKNTATELYLSDWDASIRQLPVTEL